MLRRWVMSAALLLGCVGFGNCTRAGEVTLQALLERVQKLEDKNTELEKKIAASKNLTTAVDQAVAKADEKFSAVITAPDPNCRPLTLGGYLDVSYEYNFDRPNTGVNNLRAFDRDANSFDVHMAKLYASRLPTKPGEAGFRMDLAFGEDANKFASTDLSGLPTDRLMDLEQAYVSYIAPVGNGITVDAGKFVTPFGAEVIEAADDINSSRSLLFTWAIPFTHTGVRATYPVFTDKWTVAAYLVNGWDNLQDANNAKSGIVSSNWTPKKWFNLVVNAGIGNEATEFGPHTTAGPFSQAGTRFLLDSTATFTPWEPWTFAVNADYGTESACPWWGVATYVKYQLAKKWYIAGRGEYFADKAGARTGTRQSLWEGTLTFDYALSDPCHLRFEYRHDSSNREAFGDAEFVEGDSGPVFSGNDRRSQDTAMVQWLYKF